MASAKGQILLVPGFMGCTLSTQRQLWSLGQELEVWLNYAFVAGGGYRYLQLAADGVTPSLPGLLPLVPGGCLQAYYGQLVSGMNGLGWDVWSAQLDWRGSLAADAERLADTVEQMAPSGLVNIVAHSRGGLVVRLLPPVLEARGKLAALGRTVCLGAPHFGSWFGCGIIAQWAGSYRLVRNLIELVHRIIYPAYIPPGLPEAFSSWPAAYQLFPAPGAPGLPVSVSNLIYSAAAWAATGLPFMGQWLAAAAAQWNALPPYPFNLPYCDIIGTGWPTPSSLIGDSLPLSESDLSSTLDGDGTVPRVWAVQPGRQLGVAPDTHHALVYDGRVHQWIDAVLTGKQTANFTVVGSPLA